MPGQWQVIQKSSTITDDLLECTLCDNDQEFQEGIQTARKPGIPPTSVVSFSPEEITCFQARFEEGYDLPDERYSAVGTYVPS